MIGVLNLQGAVVEHLDHLDRLGIPGIPVKDPADFRKLSGLLSLVARVRACPG